MKVRSSVVALLFVCPFIIGSRDAHGSSLDEARRETIHRIMFEFLQGIREGHGILPELYVEEAEFVDPMFPEGIKGHEAILRYHENLNAMTEQFDVEVRDVLANGDRYIVLWEATVKMAIRIDVDEALRSAGLPTFGLDYSLTALRVGPIVYKGTTEFEFPKGESRVSLHRDYYDSLIAYLEYPVIGPMLRFLNEQAAETMMR